MAEQKCHNVVLVSTLPHSSTLHNAPAALPLPLTLPKTAQPEILEAGDSEDSYLYHRWQNQKILNRASLLSNLYILSVPSRSPFLKTWLPPLGPTQ